MYISMTNFMRHLRRVHPIKLAAYEAPRTAFVIAMQSVGGQEAASTSAEVSASTLSGVSASASADILAA